MYCDLTNAASMCHFLFQGKNNFPYLLQSRARNKGVSLFQMWVLYCIILHSLHIQYVTCQKVFQFLASTSMLPFASHFSISISILFIHRNTFYIWFINSTQQYLCTLLHIHNKCVMKDCRAKTVYYLHYMRLWIHHIHSHFCSLQQSEYFPHFKRRSCWNTNLHSFNL